MKKKYIDEYFYDTHLTVELHDDPEANLVRLTQKKEPTSKWSAPPSVSVHLDNKKIRSLALTLNLMADIMEGK